MADANSIASIVADLERVSLGLVSLDVLGSLASDSNRPDLAGMGGTVCYFANDLQERLSSAIASLNRLGGINGAQGLRLAGEGALTEVLSA